MVAACNKAAAEKTRIDTLAADDGAWEMTRTSITVDYREDGSAATTIIGIARVIFTANPITEVAALRAEASGSKRQGEERPTAINRSIATLDGIYWGIRRC
ncbi:hypothetical protein Ct61P_15117 [Colletotrichum tofieldiae]|nr:hypothetical protein Ct61P_15117 [Colletotrichum tofieldiae]